MKKVFLIMMVSLSFQGRSIACSDESIRFAKQLLSDVKIENEKGEIGITSVIEAKAHLLEMQLCKKPNDVKICKELVKTLSDCLESYRKLFNYGEKSLSEVTRVNTQYAVAKSKCK